MTNAAPAPGPLLVSAGLVWWRGRLVVQRRPPSAAHGAGRLELPGGKLEPGEGPREALARELVEEWGPHAAGLVVGPVAEITHHRYPAPGPEVLLMIFHVDGAGWGSDDPAPQLRPLPGAAVEIHAPHALPAEAFLAADLPFVARLRAGEIGSPFA